MTTEEKLNLALQMLENLCWDYSQPDPYAFRDEDLGQYTDEELAEVGLDWLPKRSPEEEEKEAD